MITYLAHLLAYEGPLDLGNPWRDATLFLCGVSVSGALSYVALWGAFAKNAVTHAELDITLRQYQSSIEQQFNLINAALNRIVGSGKG